MIHLYFDNGRRHEDLCDHDDQGEEDTVNVCITGAVVDRVALGIALERGHHVCPKCARAFDVFVAQARTTAEMLTRGTVTVPPRLAVTHGPFCDNDSVLQPPTPPAGGPWRLAGVVKLPHHTLVAYWERERGNMTRQQLNEVTKRITGSKPAVARSLHEDLHVEGRRKSPGSKPEAERSVLDAAVLLHMASTGAYQPVDDHVHAAASWLRGRLASWRPSVKWTKQFDDAVRAVLEIAIEEYDREFGSEVSG